jgi:hypothetical protein
MAALLMLAGLSFAVAAVSPSWELNSASRFNSAGIVGRSGSRGSDGGGGGLSQPWFVAAAGRATVAASPSTTALPGWVDANLPGGPCVMPTMLPQQPTSRVARVLLAVRAATVRT